MVNILLKKKNKSRANNILEYDLSESNIPEYIFVQYVKELSEKENYGFIKSVKGKIHFDRIPNLTKVKKYLYEPKNTIHGGLGDKYDIPKLAKKYKMRTSQYGKIYDAIDAGIGVEYEHTKDFERAKGIAFDHLVEAGMLYYTELSKMEKRLEDNPQKFEKGGKTPSKTSYKKITSSWRSFVRGSEKSDGEAYIFCHKNGSVLDTKQDPLTKFKLKGLAFIIQETPTGNKCWVSPSKGNELLYQYIASSYNGSNMFSDGGILPNKGKGVVINNIYRQWKAIKDEKQRKKWAEKVSEMPIEKSEIISELESARFPSEDIKTDFISQIEHVFVPIEKEPEKVIIYDNEQQTDMQTKIEKAKIEIEKSLNDSDSNEISEYIEPFADGGLIAPNGKTSNLTPEQYRLVRTPEFKAWFGDWENDPENSSKVVDENGEPLVVYHGSKRKFTAFAKDRSANEVFYFAKDRHFALTYPLAIDQSLIRDEDIEYAEKNINIYECYLRIENMFDIFNEQHYSKVEEHGGNLPDTPDFSELEQNIKYIKDAGFDGYLAWEGSENIISYAVFEPNQIKLADGTNTTFDSNPDIRFEGGGSIEGCDYGTEVQSIIISKDHFSRDEAIDWIKKHKYESGVDETENYYRFRQQEPDEFEKDSFRTIEFTDGIKAIIGCPLNDKMGLGDLVYSGKAEYAAKKMYENSKIQTLTEDQHEAIANLCKVRHDIHSNKDKLVKSDESGLKNELLKANDKIRESGLEPMNFIGFYTDGDFIDIDTISEARESQSVNTDDSNYKEWYDDNYFRISSELELLNTEIESYLSEIDKKYSTSYCPTGKSRIFEGGGDICDTDQMESGDMIDMGKGDALTNGNLHIDNGIPAVVKEPRQQIEVEQGEIIINRVDAQKHCEELSEINSEHGKKIDCQMLIENSADNNKKDEKMQGEIDNKTGMIELEKGDSINKNMEKTLNSQSNIVQDEIEKQQVELEEMEVATLFANGGNVGEKYYIDNRGDGVFQEVKHVRSFDLHGYKWFVYKSDSGKYFGVAEDRTGAIVVRDRDTAKESEDDAIAAINQNRERIDLLLAERKLSPKYDENAKMFDDERLEYVSGLIKNGNFKQLYDIISFRDNTVSRDAYSKLSGFKINSATTGIQIKQSFKDIYGYDLDAELEKTKKEKEAMAKSEAERVSNQRMQTLKEKYPFINFDGIKAMELARLESVLEKKWRFTDDGIMSRGEWLKKHWPEFTKLEENESLYTREGEKRAKPLMTYMIARVDPKGGSDYYNDIEKLIFDRFILYKDAKGFEEDNDVSADDYSKKKSEIAEKERLAIEQAEQDRRKAKGERSATAIKIAKAKMAMLEMEISIMELELEI